MNLKNDYLKLTSLSGQEVLAPRHAPKAMQMHARKGHEGGKRYTTLFYQEFSLEVMETPEDIEKLLNLKGEPDSEEFAADKIEFNDAE